MTEEQRFNQLVVDYFATRQNKRYGKDAMTFELNWVSNIIHYMQTTNDKSFRINHNYTFLVSKPRWREIFATEFIGRLADHEIYDKLSPYMEKILTPRTYNNRKGKGSQAAMNQVIEDTCMVSNNYTKKSWIIKLDFSGYFPNALWDVAEQKLCEVVDLFEDSIKSTYGEEWPNYLKWLIMICIHANPAAHCVLKTPEHFWKDYIEPQKSIRTKPEGIGAAIGRLIWQAAMGLYVNDIIKWLENKGLYVVCFVDDIVIQVKDSYKDYTLSLLPELRKKLAAIGVKLNEKKFYCQPYYNGLEFLGSHIKPYRIHLNNKTFANAIKTLDAFNNLSDKYYNIDKFVASVNSYTGMLKNRTDCNRLKKFKSHIGTVWWKWLKWDKNRWCVTYKKKYTQKARLNRKYNLKLKIDKNGKLGKKKCA